MDQHRKSQVVAQRAAQKVWRERQVTHHSDQELWTYVARELNRAEQNAVFQGHIDRAKCLAYAGLCLAEIRTRGVQLTLEI